MHRRINIATTWASNRISLLDNFDRYEDSYSLTEEFREWILCINQHPEEVEETLLKVPHAYLASKLEETVDSDELLEL